MCSFPNTFRQKSFIFLCSFPFKAIYKSVKLCVCSLGKFSDCFDNFVGVKQGEPLSPLLFILFLNLSEELNVKVDVSTFDNSIIEEYQKFILLFADDTLLLANTVSELQSLLNKMSLYCRKWNITVNVNTTKVMLSKCLNRPENIEVLYDGSILENVRNFIYLGVNVTCNGKFFQAQKHLSKQASKALYALSNVFNDTVLLVHDKLKLFDSIILPILMYDSEIWDSVEAMILRKFIWDF